MFKILYFTDIQISNKNLDIALNVFDQIIEVSKNEKPDICIFGGDLFENKRFLDVSVFNKVYGKMYEISKTVNEFYLIPGNHDYSVMGDQHSMESLFPFSKVLDKRVNGIFLEEYPVNLIGVPYRSDWEGMNEELNKLTEMDNEKPLFLFFHNEIDNLKVDGFTFKSPIKLDLLDKFDLAIGGHIHKRVFLKKNVFYPGAPFQHNFKEVGNPGGVLIIEVENEKISYRFNELDFPKYLIIKTKEDLNNHKKELKNAYINLYIDNQKLIEKLMTVANSVNVIPVVKDNKNLKEKNDNSLDVLEPLIDYFKRINVENSDQRIKEFKNEFEKKRDTHKQINILEMKAQNALSYKELYVDFSKFRNNEPIVICGNNGAGKSSIIEILYEGLFGKHLRERNADSIINRDVQKDCFIKIKFSVNDEVFVIERYRKHHKHEDNLYFYKEGEVQREQVKGKSLKQNDINEILGSSTMFHQLVMLDNLNQFKSFSEAKPSERKSVFENVLGISWLNKTYEEITKELDSISASLNMHNIKKEGIINEIESMNIQLRSIKKMIEDYNEDKNKNIIKFSLNLNKLREKVQEITSNIDNLKRELNKLDKIGGDIDEQIQEYKQNKMDDADVIKKKVVGSSLKIKDIEKELERWENKRIKFKKGEQESVTCDFCLSEYSPLDVIEKINNKIRSCNVEYEKYEEIYNKEHNKLSNINKKYDDKINKLINLEKENRKERNRINILINEAVVLKEKALTEMEGIEKQKEKYENDSLYNSLENDLKKTRNRIKEAKERLVILEDTNIDLIKRKEYLEFWKVTFSQKGFRIDLFNSLIPIFEDKTNEYLKRFNMECIVKLEGVRKDIGVYIIDRRKKNKKAVEFSTFSGGEKNKISFSQILSLFELTSKLTMKINVMFLDEIITLIDNEGIEDICEMTREFVNKNKCLVFSISHLTGLSEIFNQQIYCKNTNGISNIERMVIN